VTVNHVEMAADVGAVIDWAIEPDGVLAGRVDATRVAVMGHSLGGKIAAMTAGADARVTALFGIDPVNAGNPVTGFSAALPDILPETLLPLTIPMGFAGETTNAEGFGQPCAPRAGNFEQFYGAATASPWAASWEIEGADHMDFPDSCALLCGSCSAGSADPAAVRATTQTLAVAFLRLHFLADGAQEAWLTGASVPAGVTALHRP
jgi:predicted dienelactone hydrolase